MTTQAHNSAQPKCCMCDVWFNRAQHNSIHSRIHTQHAHRNTLAVPHSYDSIYIKHRVTAMATTTTTTARQQHMRAAYINRYYMVYMKLTYSIKPKAKSK